MKEYYKYFWEITFNIPNRKIKYNPYSLVRFTKNCDYFGSSIPTYELIVKVHDASLNIFRMYDKELVVNIKQKMIYGESEDNLNKEKIIFEDVFIPFYDKNTFPAFNKTNKTVEASVDNYKSTYVVNDTPGILTPYEIRFVLLSKRDLAVRKYIHSYVLGSEKTPGSAATAVGFIIS